jgi:hypothetical protein
MWVGEREKEGLDNKWMYIYVNFEWKTFTQILDEYTFMQTSDEFFLIQILD